MGIELYCYIDKEGKCYEAFDVDHLTHDIIRCSTYDYSEKGYRNFWQVRILPDHPTGRTRIVAQCDTMEEAVEKLVQLAQ